MISSVIKKLVSEKHAKESVLIPNGVELPTLPTDFDRIRHFGLEPGRYVLLVSRLVPEKRHLDLIQAFQRANIQGWKLALVGASDHPDAYTKSILEKAEKTPHVICTGLQTGETLRQLYAHAGMFVLPSSHEGLPIALLEALSFGLQAVASDIDANLEVGLADNAYFPLGDIDALAARIRRFAMQQIEMESREHTRHWVTERYNWKKISEATLQVYLT